MKSDRATPLRSIQPGAQSSQCSRLETLHLALIYAFGTLATIALGVVIAVLIVGDGHITLVPTS